MIGSTPIIESFKIQEALPSSSDLNNQLDNLEFRLKDIYTRIISFRAHQMRTIMDSPSEAQNVITRVLADKTLAACMHDFSGALYLLLRESLTANSGESIYFGFE